MNATGNQGLVIAAVVVLVVLAIAVWLWNRRRQSEHLVQRFGPEYERTLHQHGNRSKAEADLRDRERRVEKLKIVPLAPAEAQQFAQDWRALQARFVDNPKGVLMDADRLVREVMLRRGYPMGDFERRAADISVDHPAVVDHYRTAHAIAQRDHRGETNTEDLRQAVIHYRALFDELLEVREPTRAPAEEHMEVH